VAAGSISANFTLTGGTVSSVSVTATVTATLNGTASTSVTVNPNVNRLTGLRSSSTIMSGSTSTATVSLMQPAPTGGAVVSLSTTDATTLSVPASVMVAAGATTANFATTAGCVKTDQPVTLNAAFNGSSMAASVTVQAGLAAAYAFDEGSGQTVTDSS